MLRNIFSLCVLVAVGLGLALYANAYVGPPPVQEVVEYEDGTPCRIAGRDTDGNFHGEYQEFWMNGRLKASAVYYHGAVASDMRFFDQDGKELTR